MDFSVDSLWYSQRFKNNLPLVLTIISSVLLAIFAVILKFGDLIAVTYRDVECKDILPYHDSYTDMGWIDIDDEYFAASVIGFAILSVSASA